MESIEIIIIIIITSSSSSSSSITQPVRRNTVNVFKCLLWFLLSGH